MLIAVTGGTGYVGARTVRALLEAKHSVRLLVEPGWRNDDLQGALSELGPLTVIHGDVRDTAVVEGLLDGCDSVLHAAGIVGTDDSRRQLMWGDQRLCDGGDPLSRRRART